VNLKVALFLILAGLNLLVLIFGVVPILIVSRGSKGWVRFGVSLVGVVSSCIGAVVSAVRGVQ
jgi:hypothetical protein